ncbi:hypothetical protein AK830_g7026 [Neonectria ditissima]|uniref:Hybrid signal transduction histidine kinase K n=1 Tax=Neonectria ditissima TaxID=78410 RepID=A0A0P7BG67_9HYPO|nr:hypothetical protein AK830_g7026 [Neonectria ditissima]
MESQPGDALSILDIRDILNADSRPTFIIDLDPDEELPPGLQVIRPVFCNSALRLHERLHDVVCGNESPDTTESGQEFVPYEAFKSWATGITTQDDAKDVFPLSFSYNNLLWTGSTVSKRWRLISGNRSWRADMPLRNLSSGTLHEATAANSRRQKNSTPRRRKPRSPELEQATPKVEPEAAETTVEGSTATDTTLAASFGQQLSFRAAWQREASKGSSDEVAGSSNSGSIVLGRPDKAVADWTAKKPKGILHPHLEFCRSIDWASTPLGAMNTWSPALREIANLCMNNPHPINIFWGSELTMLYNEVYANTIAGSKHPSMMGTGVSGPFAEIWSGLSPTFAEVVRTGISHRREHENFAYFRQGFLEEIFLSWSLTPLYGGTDRIVGFWNAPFETTELVLNQRRMQTINTLSDSLTKATTVRDFWQRILQGLEDSHRDVPFALLYSVGDADEVELSSISSGSTISLKSCHLEGTLGVPNDHIAAPSQLDLKRSYAGFVPSFREAMRTREPTLLHTRDGTLPEELLDGINWRGFGDPCREAIIFPIRPTNGDAVLAFLVLGVNPRRPYDDQYKSFVSLLNRQLATSLASTILFEDETRRSRDAVEAAALEKEELMQQLNLQASRLRRMTELSPLGMFLISPEGVLREANDRFYEMTGHTRDPQSEMSWVDFILESSVKTMEEGWHRLTIEHLPWSGELRLKTGARSPASSRAIGIDHWVLFTAHLELSSTGSLRSIMGSITDISHLKWAQGLQNRQLQEAEDTRRQQNEFIDITSHEMRNPLSAILQCADDISSTLGPYNGSSTGPSQAVIESCVDAAQTIALCVQHQRSIVDDILTISKLDSNLLLITPVACQPEAILQRVLKMFESEVRARDIKLSLQIRPEFAELAVDWVTMDPSRVLQILINLMTNAIKFTASSQTREISVVVGVSREPPDGKNIPGFEFVPTKTGASNIVSFEDRGSGEVLYIRFRVQDSGCGLTDEERRLLFQRFKQASPRTHAQYGGSGLGLFISKRLSELHGGQIGVASVAGKGSHFGFYIKARRSNRPIHEGAAEPLLIEIPTGVPIPTKLPIDSLPQHAVIPTPEQKPVAPKLSNGFEPSELDIHVVEDNIINQKVLVKQLKKFRCTVSATNDGIEALAFLRQTHFCQPGGIKLSVILMDLEMPNMDGLTCVREIRKMQRDGTITGHVPVIAVTANVRDEQVKTALESGIDDVLSKPFRIPDVLRKIEALLRDLQR